MFFLSDLEKAKAVMKAEDKHDKAKEKLRIKERHKEQKRKEKEAKGKRRKEAEAEGKRSGKPLNFSDLKTRIYIFRVRG